MGKYTGCVSLLLLFLWGCRDANEERRPDYPQWEPSPKSTYHFGTTVEDPYPNLMELKDSTVLKWFNAQDALAEDYFSNNGATLDYLEHFSELENREGEYVSLLKQSTNGWYFYLKYEEHTKRRSVYVLKKGDGEPIYLFDPEKLGEVTYLEPSYDGRYLAMGIPQEGGFSSKVWFLDVERQQLLPDQITNSNPDFGGIEWLPDSSGFVYLYFPEVDKEKPGYKKESYSVLYLLGQEPDVHRPIFGSQHGLEIPRDHYPKVKISSPNDNYVIGYIASSGNFYDAYIAKMENLVRGRPQWKPFFKAEAQIFYNQGEIREDAFIYRQATSEGNRLCEVSLVRPDFDHPNILAVGSRDNPITKFELTKDHIYFMRERFGVEVSLYQLEQSTHLAELALPFIPGYAQFFGESVMHNDIGVSMDGWTSDTARYLLRGNGNLQPLQLDRPVSYPEFEELVSRQVMVPSHDGTEVPLSLVYPKDRELHANQEVFVYVYGAYGDSMSPFFFPMFLDWAAQGGILAFPHVRGGGEKGPEWHKQGQKTLKYNSWKDLIACMDYLVEQDYTRKGLISLYTNSAGGITAGMAINERPDLFSSLIAEFPRLHPYGLEASQTASSTSYMEYGSVTDSIEFHGLLRMDPYLNVEASKPYPATLVLTSYNDDRIPLWDNGKYIARRQAAKGSKTPVLMDIDFESGHERLSDYEASILLHSKIFGFAKTHMQVK